MLLQKIEEMLTEKLINNLQFSFQQLYDFKKEDRNLYYDFFNILNNQDKEILDYMKLLYIAYYLNNKISYRDFEKIISDFSLYEITLIFYEIYSVKKNSNFRTSFRKKLSSNGVSIPEFKLEDVEDYYTYYVLILDIPETIFWNSNFSFLLSVAENKSAYDSFTTYIKQKIQRKN